jgi:hypothetical protein
MKSIRWLQEKNERNAKKESEVERRRFTAAPATVLTFYLYQ